MTQTRGEGGHPILRTITGRAPWVLAGVALATVLSLAAIVDVRSGRPRLTLDPSVDSMLPTGDEGRIYYDRVRELFGSGDTVLVALMDEDIFTTENLRRIQRITERVEELDQVLSVSSLATALNIRNADGSLRVEPFYDDVPEDPSAIADLRTRALADPIYSGNLVSRDGRVSVLLVTLLDLPARELIESRIDEEITRIAGEESGGIAVWVTGGAHVKAEMSRLMMVDLTFVLPLAISVMALVALVSFRTLRGVVIPVVTVAISLTASLALAALAFETLNMVTVAAPPILIVVGFAYAIHIVAAYYDVLRESPGQLTDEGEIVFAVLKKVAVPVTFTGITTAAGFFSLTTSSLVAIRQFGIFCGVGVLLTTLVSLAFGGALLQLLPVPRSVGARRTSERFNRFLAYLALYDLYRRTPILVMGVVVGVVSLVGMSRIQVRTDMVSNFKQDNPVRQHFDRVNEHLEGANAVNVVLETSYPDAFKDPANLRVIDELGSWLHSQPEVGGTTSLIDYVKAINQGFHDGEAAYFAVPGSSDLVAQLLIVGSNDELDRFVDSSYQTANIVVRTTAIDSADVLSLVERIEDRLTELPQHLQARVTGDTVLVSKTVDEIALGQALSLGSAFLFIYIILAILFTSPWSGFMALLPNLLPVLIYFGILGWTGVSLNTTTGLVACLVLGIAVDDTIHLLSHYNRAAHRYADERKGVVAALTAVGRPITYTTVALCLGFLCLTLSSMRNQVEFGLLSAFTLATAWLVDVTFTPALASRMHIVNLWDVLTLDLGAAPHRTIPLFKDLKHTQARIVALMTRMRRFTKGEEIFSVGDAGEDMYVVIEGELEVSFPSEEGDVSLRKLERGDLIGEVGFFHGRRSANVRASTDVRLLHLTKGNLRNLQGRHPRIAAQIYANLGDVLAYRLASVTPRVH